jgi:hypothetical protein
MVAVDLRDPYDIAFSLRDWSRHWERQIVPSGYLVGINLPSKSDSGRLQYR